MPLTLFRPSHSFSQSCPASCDQPQFEFVRFCTRLTGSTDVFVEVLARVKGKPSVGHTPPLHPLHSDTVTKGDAPPSTTTNPSDCPLYPRQQGQTQRPGQNVLSLALPQQCIKTNDGK